MRRLATMLCSVVLCGCSGEGESGPCEMARGNYLLTATERYGDCGDFELVVTINPDMPPTNCTGPQTLSEDRCMLESDITCTNRDLAGNPVSISRLTGTVVAADTDVERLEGVATIQFSDLSGQPICAGTFDLLYRKQ